MKYEIKNSFSGEIQFTAEIDATEDNSTSVKIGLAVKWAYKTGAYLEGADLEGAYLEGAYLKGAYLKGAYLKGAYLKGAYLKGAYLKGAYLKGAYLKGAYLKGAYLEGADLEGAYLEGAYLEGEHPAKEDLFKILAENRTEVPMLLQKLREGKINGSVYEGDCACLVGTIAKIKACDYRTLAPDSHRPAEKWFMSIYPGQIPGRNGFATITEKWILEFLAQPQPENNEAA